MDGYDRFTQTLGKYIFPLIFGVAGLYMLIKGLTPDADTGVTQTTWFVNAGLFLTLMSALMGLHIAGILKKKIGVILIPVLVALCGWFAYMNYQSVAIRMAEEAAFEKYLADTKQGLTDLRDIQVAFKRKYQKYAGSAAELKQFLLNDFLLETFPDDRVTPDRKMTEAEALQLGYDLNTVEGEKAAEKIDDREAVLLGHRQIDTVSISVMDYLFNGTEIKLVRKDSTGTKEVIEIHRPKSDPENRAYVFDPNLAWEKRGGDNAAFKIETADIGDTVKAVPVFMIRDMTPYDPFKRKDTLQVGSLTKHSTEGNWDK